MIYKRFKRTVQLTALIFTGITFLEMAAGQQLNNRVLYEILICAAIASLIKYCFFQEVLFEYSIGMQMLYLAVVWLVGILCNFIFGWGMTRENIISTPAIVLIIYIAIRLINYQFDKEEVKKMNERLKGQEENKKNSP